MAIAIEMLVEATFVAGYALITLIAFRAQEHHCWGHALLTGAAMGHLILLLVRSRKKPRTN